MNSENPAKQKNSTPNTKSESNQHATPTQPVISPVVGAAKPEAPPPSEKCKQSKCSEKHWLDYLEAGMGGLGLVVLVVYTIFTGLMYCANKKAADAAKSAADTASKQLILSEKSIDATVAQFQLDQRAWLGVSQPIVASLKDAQSGKPDFRAQVINTGKTPATNVSIAPVTSIIKKGEFCKTTYKPETVLFAGVHVPTAINTIAFPFGEREIGPSELAAIETGQLSWCIYAKISYNDVFKDTPVHVTEFCGVLQRDKTHFTACKHNNYAD
jgi:hypothetical protein